MEIYLDDADSIANLEAVAKSGTGKRRPRVRVDLAGAEFFSMEEVASEFKAEKAVGSRASTRTQLGYGTTEEVRCWRCVVWDLRAGKAVVEHGVVVFCSCKRWIAARRPILFGGHVTIINSNADLLFANALPYIEC